MRTDTSTSAEVRCKVDRLNVETRTACHDPTDPRPLTRVVVGILARRSFDAVHVLLAQRPPGKVYAGYWEFPGGKIEIGETALQALARELDEELGVTVNGARALVTESFSYPHAHVQLEFFVCDQFVGEPCGREGQRTIWQPAKHIGVTPLLPALLHPASRVLPALAALSARRADA